MQNPGDMEGYLSLVRRPRSTSSHDDSDDFLWQNAADGLSALHVLLYRPLNRIQDVTTIPTLFVAAQNDTLCPASYVERAVSIMKKHDVNNSNNKSNPNMESILIKDQGHFGIYSGKSLLMIIDATLEFYSRHL
jgi:pimeloyl-ACP methyl ester carboxylesterase